jgi:P4 family phage/plasmid primase-like protien
MNEDVKDITKPETETDKLAREKGISTEDAWKLQQEHKEDDHRKQKWAEQDERKKLIEKWVWKYWEQGDKPIPIKEQSKEPNIEKTSEWFYKDIPREQIQQWLDEGRYKNVATLGGKNACLDVDNPRSFTDLNLHIKDLMNSGARITETPKEPGRYHIVVGNKGNEKITRKSAEGIELRCYEHYWLVYPSIHPNGKLYNLLNTKDPEKLQPPREIDILAMYDNWISELRRIRKTDEKDRAILKNKKPFDKSPDCIRIAWETGAQQGERYYTAIGLGSWLQQKNFPLEMAQATVVQWFHDKCPTEGRSDDEIKAGAEVGYIGEKYQTGCKYWKEKTKYCPYPDENDCPYRDMIGANKRALLKQYDVFWTDNKNKEHVNCPRLADLILNGDNHHYLVIQETQEILAYNGSYFETGGERIIEQRTNYYLDDQYSIRIKNEVLNCIKTKEYVKQNELEPPLNLINVKNGVFDIEKKELLPHSPEYRFINQVNAKYDPNAKIVKIDEYLKNSVDGNDQPLIQEFLGDCLQRSYSFKRAIMCVGERDTGKSQLLNMIDEFLGRENVSNITLYDLCNDKFAVIELRGKLANSCSELDPQEISHVTKFLALTGGDWMSGQKKFLPRFKFKSYAKVIFACNKIPDAKCKNPAFYVRWIVIVFSNIIDFKDQIEDYWKTFCTEEEFSGLLNWALEGLYRLKKNHGYSEHKTLDEVTEYIQKGSNPIREFVDQYVHVSATSEIIKEELHLSYVEFCRLMGYPYKSDIWFSRCFKPLLPLGAVVEDGRPRGHGHKPTWKGIDCSYKRVELASLDAKLDSFSKGEKSGENACKGRSLTRSREKKLQIRNRRK